MMAEEQTKKTTSIKATKTAKKVREFVRTMYMRAHQAKAEGRPVAYCMMASGYDEILLAMDITPVWTENYAGLCAAKHEAEPFLLRAEADGYSNVVCGYVRTGLGFDAMRKEQGGMPKGAPDGGMPEPDMLLGSSCTCDPRYKWYQSMGHYTDTPTYCHDVVIPSVDANYKAVTPHYIKYQVQQFRGLIAWLEEQTGKKMDYDKLRYHVDLANRAAMMWWQSDQLRKAIPSPMPSQDHFNIFTPGVFRLGEQATLDFYTELRDEIQERVDNHIGVVENEQYRLMWGGGLPPWHTMWMFNYFESMGAVFAIESAYMHWEPRHIPEGISDPVEHIATRNYRLMTNYYEEAQANSGDPAVEKLLRLAKDYSIDGMVMHGSRSCRAMTIGQMHSNATIQKQVNLPFLGLVSDIVDLRDYSEAQWRMQIDSFMETVRNRKAQGR
ncbi:MAG: 2-hydroxyacyl-CoA dehydratase family protein [Dehalococcoidia bacterium]|nr:2-hydroxyacyl-CoA dehydratase family protein [Dehalococcoidia bacterium]